MARKSSVAKVFWSGRSQAVRLPKAYRVEASELRIWREGRRVILEPIDAQGWPDEFWEVFGQADASLDLGERTRVAERANVLADLTDPK